MSKFPTLGVVNAGWPQKATTWRKVDRLTDLRIDDPAIHRDAKIFENIKISYRRNIRSKGYIAKLRTAPTLYSKLRGPQFPLRLTRGKMVPRWKMLSPWMKIQIASLVLIECGYATFTVNLHDELGAELAARGIDLTTYLRDRITRSIKKEYGEARWFFFFMEDSDEHGQPTRPHAHGAIEIRRGPLPIEGQMTHLKFKRMSEKKGAVFAEREYARLQMRGVLQRASGNLVGNVVGKRPSVVAGVNQSRNLWLRFPEGTISDSRWVTYVFKNGRTASARLGNKRLAFSTALNSEARKVWDLIREGESAMAHWA